MSQTSLIVKVPRLFFEDHEARDLPRGYIIRRMARQVLVDLDQVAYDDLLGDAQYYAEPDPSWTARYDAHLLAISRSARRTVAVLEQHERPLGRWTYLPDGTLDPTC